MTTATAPDGRTLATEPLDRLLVARDRITARLEAIDAGAAATSDSRTVNLVARRAVTRELERRRALAAELALLTRYDMLRDLVGHDYGRGQRYSDLRRRERALGPNLVALAYHAAGVPTAVDPILEPLTRDELVAAWQRVGRPRMARLAREGYRADTPASRRTLRTWQRTETYVRLYGDTTNNEENPTA
jgi:hypothetical protein